MTPSSKTVLEPTAIGAPMNTVNAFEALSAVSSVMSKDDGESSPTKPAGDKPKRIDQDGNIGVIAQMAFTGLQALLDNSYETYFGSENAMLPVGTPLWMKELFDKRCQGD